MSKRKFAVIAVATGSPLYVFNFQFTVEELFEGFKNHKELKDTELAYTLIDDIDLVLDLKEDQTIHYYEDRAKEFPCLLKRIS